MTTDEKVDLVDRKLADALTDFLYYDRKEDEELSREDLEVMVETGIITIDWIVDRFEHHLRHAGPPYSTH